MTLAERLFADQRFKLLKQCLAEKGKLCSCASCPAFKDAPIVSRCRSPMPPQPLFKCLFIIS